MLVAAITQPTLDDVIEEIRQAKAYADVIEIRLDYLQENELKRLGEIPKGIPLIFTFRKEAQGGVRPIEEKKRLEAIEKALEFHPAYCDLETDTDPAAIERIAKKFPSVKLIGSHHNFQETPQEIHLQKNRHFLIYKLAFKANSTIDMLRLMAFAKRAKEPISCISMGADGKPSRVLGPVVGNALDYSGVEEDSSLHRQSLKTLCEVYHYKKLNRDTEVYGLIGDPVEQSPGDLYHNEQFRKEGRNAVYIKLRLRPEELASFFELVEKLSFRGFSVTIPLKEAILPFVENQSEIQAVNTILLGKKIIGTNTDAPGALDAIEKHLPVKGRKVSILGAGGSAKAIVHEALKRGAKVTVFNRTVEKGQSLGCPAYSLDELPNHPYDLLINTLPPSAEPIPSDHLIGGSYVMDIVYYPKMTPLLTAAKARGCPLIFGEEMFQGQARLQQLFWFKTN